MQVDTDSSVKEKVETESILLKKSLVTAEKEVTTLAGGQCLLDTDSSVKEKVETESILLKKEPGHQALVTAEKERGTDRDSSDLEIG